MDGEQTARMIREIFSAAIAGDTHLMAEHPGLQDVLPTFEAANEAFSERAARFPLQFNNGVEWIATRMIESGRHTGDFMGLAPTGNSFEFEVLMFHRVEQGLIVAQHSQADAGALMRALGAFG